MAEASAAKARSAVSSAALHWTVELAGTPLIWGGVVSTMLSVKDADAEERPQSSCAM